MANLPYNPRDLHWLGDSRKTVAGFPLVVRQKMGFGLRVVQNGETPDIAKPLTSYGAGVFELRQSGAAGTYRVVYAVKLKHGVYVLDAFMKKSKQGKAIPREIQARIKQRLKDAKAHDKEQVQ